MNEVVRVNGVHKRYRSKTALNNVSFEVPPSVVMAVLGENGAGKTTLVNALLGLTRIDSGEISVLGMDPAKRPIALRKQIGFVPDNPALYDWMSIEQTGWFTGNFYGPNFVPDFMSLVTEFGLTPSDKINELSRGGRAKVALALSLAHRPSLLVLDEPTAGLDTIVRRQFLESMIDIAADGRTVLLCSHQISEVERVADYVAVMHDGNLIACDSLESLKSRYERWVITVESQSEPLPLEGMTVLLHDGKDSRRQQLVVRDCDPEALWKVRDHVGVTDVEVHPPNLEEIFVALIKSGLSELTTDHTHQDVTPASSTEAEQ